MSDQSTTATGSDSLEPATEANRAERMAATLRATLPGASLVEVLDESWEHAGHMGANASGLGTHMRVRLVAPQLAGLSRVAQHRLVYDALRPYVDIEGVHALAIEAKASA